MSTNLFEARGISKRFGAVVALEGVDFAIHGGEVVALLGDNGAGKSTFVKILSGVYSPDRGVIHFDGKAARFRSAADARRLGIETVHQDLGLVDSMSITRNFFLGAELRRGPFLDLRRMEERTVEALRQIGLVNLRNVGQDVGALSGGERQAISIGRAIAFQRRMLILDEPTSALSVKETDKVFEYVRSAKARELAVVVVMHNLTQVREIADRFAIFWHGRKVADVANVGQSERELSEYILFGAMAASNGSGADASVLGSRR
jgi:simple sugar transport system ATP-binding protein